MTKQEEIDRALILYARAVSEVEERELMTHSIMRKEWGILLEKVKHDLSDLGVVIKVDRELPIVGWEITGAETPSQAEKISEAFRKAYGGCGFFEPLIKEE